ncbi:MAG: hypothetical protein ACXWIU_10040, partial [Limisphaerales bacterium]
AKGAVVGANGRSVAANGTGVAVNDGPVDANATGVGIYNSAEKLFGAGVEGDGERVGRNDTRAKPDRRGRPSKNHVATDTDSPAHESHCCTHIHGNAAFVTEPQGEVKRDLLRLLRRGSRTIVCSTNMNQPFVYQNYRDTSSHNHC